MKEIKVIKRKNTMKKLLALTMLLAVIGNTHKAAAFDFKGQLETDKCNIWKKGGNVDYGKNILGQQLYNKDCFNKVVNKCNQDCDKNQKGGIIGTIKYKSCQNSCYNNNKKYGGLFGLRLMH
jgi:hypothetical protein